MSEADSPEKTAEGVPPLPATDSSILIPPQPIRAGTADDPVDFGRTVRACDVVNVLPVLSVTVSEIVYVPFVKDWDTGVPVVLGARRFRRQVYGVGPR